MTEDDMKLPEGETCYNCAHIDHCMKMYGVKQANTECDFAPSKFTLAQDERIARYPSIVAERDKLQEVVAEQDTRLAECGVEGQNHVHRVAEMKDLNAELLGALKWANNSSGHGLEWGAHAEKVIAKAEGTP